MATNMYGELPTTPVIFAACDSKYFMEHALPFACSSSKSGFDTHIHVNCPDEEVFAHCAIINATCENKVTYTFDDIDPLKILDEEQARTFYACLRFYILPDLLPSAKKVMTLDIDCLVMRNFEFPETPMGYFPRKNEEHPGMKVAAGAVYMTNEAIDVSKAISVTIDQTPRTWFADQRALSHIFDQILDEYVTCFDNTFMDWEFVEGTAIWTGKGPRKYDNPIYVAKKEEFTKEALDKVSTAKSILLKPRLDIPFKKFGLERSSGNIPEIRTHWANFANKVNADLVSELPRWMFNNKIENYLPEDTEILIPHLEKFSWHSDREANRYYMQTVFPWLFTIDPTGWGGGGDFVNTFNPDDMYTEDAFNDLRQYMRDGGSKFPQPKSKPFKSQDPFIFVPLQLPHDQTIDFHSRWSVEEMVTLLCEWADSSEDHPIIIFKGHPVNLQSMQPISDIISNYRRVQYHVDLNIHDVIPEAEAVYTINSGVGQEAMLHDVPVVCFGNCEYQGAVIRGNLMDDLHSVWDAVQNDDKIARAHLYRKWYHWYVNRVTFNTVPDND